jgi:hypothetical protein
MAKKDSTDPANVSSDNPRPNDTPDLEDAIRSIDAIGEAGEDAR